MTVKIIIVRENDKIISFVFELVKVEGDIICEVRRTTAFLVFKT